MENMVGDVVARERWVLVVKTSGGWSRHGLRACNANETKPPLTGVLVHCDWWWLVDVLSRSRARSASLEPPLGTMQITRTLLLLPAPALRSKFQP